MNGRLLAASLAALSVFVGGCVVAPVATHPVEVVRVAPPPPRVEYVGPPPYVGHIWISGYWNWGGARYVWVPGRWEAPRHGHRWVPHRWERDGDHWRHHGGHWEPEHRSEHRPSPRPAQHDWRRGDDDRRHDSRSSPQVLPASQAFGERRRYDGDRQETRDRLGVTARVEKAERPERREIRENRLGDAGERVAPVPSGEQFRRDAEAPQRHESGAGRERNATPAGGVRGRQEMRGKRDDGERRGGQRRERRGSGDER